MFKCTCPICGTNGKRWNKKPEVFMCPNCASLFSRFGFVLEPDIEQDEMWN